MKRQRASGLGLLLDPLRAEAALWRRARFEDDTSSREALFNRYLVLARSVAARHFKWGHQSTDRGDLEQFAYEGLLQSLDCYDPLNGVPFGVFARPRIAGIVSDGMARMSDVDAQLSRRRRMRQERVRSLAAISERSDDPLASLADLAIDLALGLMLEGTGMMATDGGADVRPTAYEGLAWRQAQAAMAAGLVQLPDKEGIVIRQHYQTGLTFARIADLLRLSNGRVSQLHRSAIERLRRRLRHY
ncbi:sigma-70 family RNA polymerase sigma factor [uncultured Sphingomonas sp.]|uniref:sigma-70 family RNA polymerase sigma factor n=1 Tax=uncultured Sphingomonas sp. TaxID=158754 RepID=UPI0035CC81D3